MIHHQLMCPAIASHPKCLNLNLRTLQSQRACLYRILWLWPCVINSELHKQKETYRNTRHERIIIKH